MGKTVIVSIGFSPDLQALINLKWIQAIGGEKIATDKAEDIIGHLVIVSDNYKKNICRDPDNIRNQIILEKNSFEVLDVVSR